MFKRLSLITVLVFLSLITVFASGCQENKKEDEKIDMNKFPNYIEDYTNLTYDEQSSRDFTGKNMGSPFWKGNVIYNESVMLVKYNNSEEYVGNLQFKPLKILSVRNFDYTVEYTEGVDYTVSGSTFKKVEGSNIPAFTESIITGAEIPAPYRKVDSISDATKDCQPWGGVSVYSESSFWYGNQIYVSYVYDIKDVDLTQYPEYNEEKVSKFVNKLKNAEPVTILTVGDSVMAGASASHKSREPHMPKFDELFVSSLEQHYHSDITLINRAVGGERSSWLSANGVKAVNDTNPDIVFIHFGINDSGANSPRSYFLNLEEFVYAVKSVKPDMEFVFVHCFATHPKIYNYEKFEEYFKLVDEFAEKEKGIDTINVFKLSLNMLKTKKYEDLTGNGINHANDYMARIYHQAISSRYIK